jgi:hypothetical protein
MNQLADALANDIRSIDGKHDMGAGELAEKLIERGWQRTPPDELAALRGAMERITTEAEVLAKDCPPSPHACPACEILFVARELAKGEA